jgi:hypothetical protein
MDSILVSWEKALKSLDKLQFFMAYKKCTFCIMYWLVNIDSKLKKMAKNLWELSLLDTKLYELPKNRLTIFQNDI